MQAMWMASSLRRISRTLILVTSCMGMYTTDQSSVIVNNGFLITHIMQFYGITHEWYM